MHVGNMVLGRTQEAPLLRSIEILPPCCMKLVSVQCTSRMLVIASTRIAFHSLSLDIAIQEQGEERKIQATQSSERPICFLEDGCGCHRRVELPGVDLKNESPGTTGIRF